MKLTIDKKEKQNGLIFKKTIYGLETTVEITSEENDLIKKHKWDKELLEEATFIGNLNLKQPMGLLVGHKSGQTICTPWFDDVECMQHYENIVIVAMRRLKNNLEAVDGFTAAGPQEIAL